MAAPASAAPAAAGSESEEEYEEVEEIVEEIEEFEELEEGEEEEEEEDDEDLVKCERLPLDFLAGPDAPQASAMAAGTRFLVIGTRTGEIHVVDTAGFLIKHFRKHDTPINDISMDEKGEFVAACSEEGKVTVTPIYEGDSAEYDFPRPIKAVAIDPGYSGKATRPLATGGLQKELVMITTARRFGFIGRPERRVIDQCQGAMHAVKWHRDREKDKDMIAWADDGAVKVYDVTAEVKILRIDRERGAPRADLYHCSLCWENGHTLLIAWTNWIAECHIKERAAYERIQDHSLPKQMGEVDHKFVVRYFLCGQAPFGDQNILMLTYQDDVSRRAPGQKSPKPTLRIMRRSTMAQIHTYKLKVAGYADLLPRSYRLVLNDHARAAGDTLCWIMSPAEVFVCCQPDDDDHVAWLLQKERFEEAISCVRSAHLSRPEHTFASVSELHLEHLTQQGRYKEAASLFAEYLGVNVARWEKWIYEYAKMQQLGAVVDYIPTDSRQIQLQKEVYLMVLHYYLVHDPPAFLKSVRKWPPIFPPGHPRHSERGIYEMEPIINSTRMELASLEADEESGSKGGSSGNRRARSRSRSRSRSRRDSSAVGGDDSPHTIISLALAELYERQCRFEEALHIHLRLGRADVFDFIERHNLHSAMLDKIHLLLEKNTELALNMLIRNVDTIPVDHVVGTLSSQRRLLYLYLYRLFRERPEAAGERSARYSDDLVELCAEFDPAVLLSLLRGEKIQRIDLDRALDTVRGTLRKAELDEEDRKNLWRSEAFLIGRMGERQAALMIMIQKIKSVKESLDYIFEEAARSGAGAGDADEELFETLIQECLQGGAGFVGDLLEHIGAAPEAIGSRPIEPIEIFKRIPQDMEIPDLKRRLVKIIRDKALNTYLKQTAKVLLKKDVHELEESLLASRRGAIAVRVEPSHGTTCAVCEQALQGVPVAWVGSGADRRAIFAKSGSAGERVAPQGVVVFLCQHSYHTQCYLEATGSARAGDRSAPQSRVRRDRFGNCHILDVDEMADPFGARDPACLFCRRDAKKEESSRAKQRPSRRKDATRR
eukprot:TRINITY_DN3915_c0_g1_i1.p1 TRINITY_DN3915_c0_g1~~TRINITY_DN3915_c0_g1_i1.p1  ORF type:complete len:1055 (+),score=406.49 TRINITY_DN3915_c0_g1_i1:77-3241(+)